MEFLNVSFWQGMQSRNLLSIAYMCDLIGWLYGLKFLLINGKAAIVKQTLSEVGLKKNCVCNLYFS